jgi:hypothetical protein
LQKLVPGIKKGTDAMKFLREQFAGARETLANPFDQLQIAVDETKEKIGMILLPYVQKFATYIIEKVVPNVEKFLDDVSNPKTEAGKTFIQIKDAISQTVTGVKDFLELFGDGDAVKGFGNIAAALVKSLPALLALKGIMANLAKAIGLMTGAKALPGGGGQGVPPVIAGGKPTPAGNVSGLKNLSMLKLAPLAGIGFGSLITPEEASQYGLPSVNDLAAMTKSKSNQPNVTNNVTINVPNADPKATADTLARYLKQNGFISLGQALRKP